MVEPKSRRGPDLIVAGHSANELGLQLSLLFHESRKTSSMLVVEAIDLGLVCLKVALVLPESATGAVFFRLKLVVDQLEVALLGAKDCVDAELLGANGVEARLSALRAHGARKASD